jgi:hypothetical protein
MQHGLRPISVNCQCFKLPVLLERETGIEPAAFSLGKWISHLFTVSYKN